MGVPGPGGPCSEILIDRGPEYGAEGDVEGAGDRYLEFWNLVFMEFDLSAVRSKEDFDIRGDLPAKSIDTGMGLERVAFLLQGVDNLYEIDEVRPVLDRAAELAGKRYGADHDDDVRLRVVADHVRSALMIIGDGVTPGNEGRGYVLRRVLRRAVRSMRLLGVEDPTLPELLPVSKDKMKASYPELEADWARISSIAYAEEEAFRQTLRAGTQIFDMAAIATKAAGGTALSGADAFKLHDTFGFPIDLTLEMADEAGIDVDRVEFRRLMTEQRDRAKADARAKKTGHVDLSAYRDLAAASGGTEFTGYTQVASEATVRGLLLDGESVIAARQGDEIELVLDRTPFYAEGGGQLGDTGRLTLADGTLVEVLDVQAPLPGFNVHRARVLSGEVTLGADVEAQVDLERRLAISRAHTATHMVHKAFREALGETATQMGSENSPGRLRFDFPNPSAVPASVLADVEARVNAVLLDDLAVTAETMTPGAGARHRGHGAVRGEVRRPRARRVRRRVGPRAVRRHAHGAHRPARASSSCSGSPRSARAYAGSRRWWVPTPTGSSPASTTWSAQLTDALKVRPDELPERVGRDAGPAQGGRAELDQLRSGRLLESAGALAAGGREVSEEPPSSLRRLPTAPATTTCAPSPSTCEAACRLTGPAPWCWPR